MVLFILLILLFLLELATFIGSLFYLSRISREKYDSLCEKIVKRFAKRNHLLSLTKLNLYDFEQNHINVDHILFGKKYIYLITDFKLDGFVYGDAYDKSWIYYNRHQKSNKYITNLNDLANQNIKDVAGLLGINSDPFVSVCLISSNCDFKLKNQEQQLNHFTHFFSLKKRIKQLETSPIDSLDKEQIYEEFKTIEEANKQYQD